MAYPTIPPVGGDIKTYLYDTAARKEFYSMRWRTQSPSSSFAGFKPGSAPLSLPGFVPSQPQQLAAAMFAPERQVPRVLINWQTGTGKSVASVLLANRYVGVFRRMSALPTAEQPTVFIIGFTKTIFLNEMLNFPELGFISHTELAEKNRLRLLALGAGEGSVEARHYNTFVGGLRRRITDRSLGGYFRFYGYKEFANRLFAPTRAGNAAGFDPVALYAQSERSGETFGALLAAAVKKKHVVVNTGLLASMKGGLLICDEVHENYNQQAKNNYGIAIQYALDTLGDEAPRAEFASATFVTGSAPEIVDGLNLLVPLSELPGGVPLRRQDFFYPPSELPEGVDKKDEKADNGGPEEDTEEVEQSVSRLLPGALERIAALAAGRVSFLLDTDTNRYPRREFAGEPAPGINYLRFRTCSVSPLHAKALPGSGSIPANAAVLYDMVFPDPEDKPLYVAHEIAPRLASAPAAWRESTGIMVTTGGRGGAVVGGSFLRADRVGQYSGKYKALINMVLESLRGGGGKIAIFHQRVRGSGVLLIQELLKANGLIDEHSNPVDGTVCALCGVTRAEHKGTHAFAAARFVMAHSDIDRSTMERSIARYNAASNADGREYVALVGSKIVKQSVSFRAVRLAVVVSVPSDIATYIQVVGRVYRQGSHNELPAADRTVRVETLAYPHELKRYATKMKEYLVIQEIMRAIWPAAPDAFANYGRVAAAGLVEGPSLDVLPYKPLVDLEGLRPSASVATFEAYGWGEAEVKEILEVCRVLFGARGVWTYADLLAAVRADAVRGVARDPAGFSEGNFALALKGLERGWGNPPACVRCFGKYYVLCPLGPDGVIIDYECYLRPPVCPGPTNVRLADRLKKPALGDTAAVAGMLRGHPELVLVDVPEAFHVAAGPRLVEGKVVLDAKSDAILYATYKAYRIIEVKGSKTTFAKRRSLAVYDGGIASGGVGWAEEFLPAAASRPENDIVVGFVTDRDTLGAAPDTEAKFKLRPPMHRLVKKKGARVDIRGLDRGAVCETRGRDELLAVAKKLGVAAQTSAPALCLQIKLELLRREKEARATTPAGMRWLYLFNEKSPSVALAVRATDS